MNDDKDVERLVTQARKLCHDINQPLTVLMARSELMMLKIPQDDPNRKSIEQMYQQTEKITELVENLRDLFRHFQGD